MVALAVFRVAGCAQWRMLPWGPVRVGVPLDGKATIAEAACDAAAVDAGAVEGRSITPRKDLHRDPRRPPVLCSSGLPVLCSSGHIRNASPRRARRHARGAECGVIPA